MSNGWVVNNEKERMRMEAVVLTFGTVFLHLFAKMRVYEKPQPANTAYLTRGGGTGERKKDEISTASEGRAGDAWEPSNKKMFFFPTPLSPWKKFPSLKHSLELHIQI